jgi:phytoene synthase
MLLDTKKSTYENWSELREYVHGSAEVIGPMMCQIMGLPKISWYYAKKLGFAMQFANMIRDIEFDNRLGRTYIPKTDLVQFHLKDLREKTILRNKDNFLKLIHYEIQKFYKYQNTAERGFKYIPKRYLIAIKTASDMYKWTMDRIYKNPYIIYEKQLKPPIYKIFFVAISNFFKLYMTQLSSDISKK